MTSRPGLRAARGSAISPAVSGLVRDCLGLILVALALGPTSPARAGDSFSTTDSLIAKVADVAFDISGEAVLVASDLGAVSAWDPEARQRLWHRPAPEVAAPTVVALAPFLATVVLGDRAGNVHLAPWRGDQAPISMPVFEGAEVVALATQAFSPLIVAGAEDGRVAVLDGTTGEVLRCWQAHDGPILWAGLAVDAAPAQVVTASKGHESTDFGRSRPGLSLWDATSGKLLVRNRLRTWFLLDFRGRQLVTADDHEGVRLRTLTSTGGLKEQARFWPPDQVYRIQCTRVRPGGDGAIVVLPAETLIWEASSGKIWSRPRLTRAPITAMAFSLDDSLAILGGDAGSLEVVAIGDVANLAPTSLVHPRASRQPNWLDTMLGLVMAAGAGMQAASRGVQGMFSDQSTADPTRDVRGRRPVGPAFALDRACLVVQPTATICPAASGVGGDVDSCLVSCSVLNIGMKPAEDVRLLLWVRNAQGRILLQRDQPLGRLAAGSSTGWVFPAALLERPDEQELTLEVVADQAEGEPSRPVVVRLPVGR